MQYNKKKKIATADKHQRFQSSLLGLIKQKSICKSTQSYCN